jgi:Undecaprenyl-phosphate galactose phosphotransferase WbaP
LDRVTHPRTTESANYPSFQRGKINYLSQAATRRKLAENPDGAVSALPAQGISALPVRRASGPALMAVTLAGADVCGTGLAVVLGFRLWSYMNPSIPPVQPVMALAPVFCVGMFAFENLYPGLGMGAVEHIRRVFRGVTLVYLMLTAAMFIARDLWADSRGGFLLAWMLSLVLAPAARWTCSLVFKRQAWWGMPVMILGAGETARRVIRNLDANRVLGYRAVVCLDDDPEKRGHCEGIPVAGRLRDAADLAAAYGTQYAIVAMPSMPRLRLTANLRSWSSIFPHILIIPDLFGVASLWTEPRDLGGILGLEIQHNLLKPANRWIKRAVDICVATAMLIVISPLIAISALWIRIVSPGRALFVQEREGENGAPVRILKLRTMYANAEQTLEQHLDANPEARAEWNQFCKLRNDPRILPGIGHLLRKTSMDEIPQLWNILKGEMSLVGPRPFPVYHNGRFDPEFRSLRTKVRPGLTGMWQVSARSDGDLDAQMSLDSYYINNWSLWLDLYILMRTARVVLTGAGAY